MMTLYSQNRWHTIKANILFIKKIVVLTAVVFILLVYETQLDIFFTDHVSV
jgi:hypothetical protein